MIIYIAGKYNAKTSGEKLKNTHEAIDIGIELMKLGHYVLIPHLTHYIDERMDYNGEPPRDNPFWYKFDNIIIPKCDALFLRSHSHGADAELKLAEKLGLKIYYDLRKVPVEK
ncbi:hypothetical protein LCGC14_0380800 [marine sediment metagenome]|uniref:DUF4406 domain-containing protein n=1 Tax=marine sediment metagenome TaxID=412755 RepID=A0A0F9T8F7_9ZZZZ